MKLAGCVFLTLITKSLKDCFSKKNSYGSQAITEPDILIGLINVFCDYSSHDGNAQSVYTSRYKNGDNISSDFMPFSNHTITEAFNLQIQNDYPEALKKMTEFVNKYLAIENNAICSWLISSLLQILDDDSDLDGEYFYTSPDGTPQKKETILQTHQFYLPAFLLGIWHYIVCCQQDNTKGKETIRILCTISNNGKRKLQTERIGNSGKYSFQLTGKTKNQPYALTPDFVDYNITHPKKNPAVIEDMGTVDIANFYILTEENNEDHKRKTDQDSPVSQTINAEKIVQQHADKIFNIEHIDVFNA